MNEACIVLSSNFYDGSPHYLTTLHAGVQYQIRIALDLLSRTKFHCRYTRLLAELNQKNESGLPLHLPFGTIDSLCELVWKTCISISEPYANKRLFPLDILKDCIQPPTLHIILARDALAEGGVAAKIIGDISSHYPWDVSRLAQLSSNTTNSYGWDVAPVPTQDLNLGSAVEMFHSGELFVSSQFNKAGALRRVSTATGAQFFFKPRTDHMSPEFDREISVLCAIASCGLDKTLKVSPFRGVVLLDNGLVVGMVFDWMKGCSLAEHPNLSNPSLTKVWQSQVEVIVTTLHRHKIVWGDVNVHNIFIDANADAWVVDFGGNCNVEFVDEELKETYEGDMQGLRRIFEEWVPLQSRRSGCAD